MTQAINGIVCISSGTAASWAAGTQVIPAGVLCYESDTEQAKIGDGVHKYSQLTWFIGSAAKCMAGSGANQLVQLDGNAKLPAVDGSQLININTNQLMNGAAFQNLTQVNAAIQAVVGAAPAALNTLAKIDAELTNDESAAAVLTNLVATKASISSVPTNTNQLTNGANFAVRGENVSEFINDVGYVLPTTQHTYAAPQVAAIANYTANGGSLTINFNGPQDFYITVNNNTTIYAANQSPGQAGMIDIYNPSGSALGWDSNFHFGTVGVPTTSGAGMKDSMSYHVASNGRIVCSYLKGTQ